jgi:hypothetical protein
MLSEALQRNANHEASLFKHLGYLPMANCSANDQRLKAWPRGLCLLRCIFSRDWGIRMTFIRSV